MVGTSLLAAGKLIVELPAGLIKTKRSLVWGDMSAKDVSRADRSFSSDSEYDASGERSVEIVWLAGAVRYTITSSDEVPSGKRILPETTGSVSFVSGRVWAVCTLNGLALSRYVVVPDVMEK